MELSVYDNHRVTVVMASGEMDAENSAQLGEELNHLLTEGTRKVVIDPGKVGFMNSSGLATLIHYYKIACSNCGDISLAALQPKIRQAFQLTHLDRIFDLQPDVARRYSGSPAPSRFHRQLPKLPGSFARRLSFV
jgi:anti-sigma B factor antagonist